MNPVSPPSSDRLRSGSRALLRGRTYLFVPVLALLLSACGRAGAGPAEPARLTIERSTAISSQASAAQSASVTAVALAPVAENAAAGLTATATPAPVSSPAPAAASATPARTVAPPQPPQATPEAKAVARPALQGPARIVDRGTTSRLAVALTFDAGADRGYAEYILDVLLYTGVRASFGMTGVWAQQNPDLVQRMALEGHRLINHSYDHGSFTGLSTNSRPLTPEQRWRQLDRTEAILTELTGQSTVPLFRSPYGDTDASVLRDIAARGYAYNILWTVDSRGWLRYSAAAIIQRCLQQAQPGAIYVMHVGAASLDGPALPSIIEGLQQAGYTFETIDEILQ
jgi:peptidoglycan-N-acetylglucosamine deacetylase